MHRHARGLLAAFILLAATIGLPIALATTIGDPLSSWTSIRGGQASDQDIMAILVTVVYLAWLSFVVPVIIEIASMVIARLIHRSPREVRLPLLGAQQDLARTLIGAVLLIVPTATAATGSLTPRPATAATATTLNGHPGSAGHRESVARDAHAHRETRATDRTYVIPDIGGMRSYWALAEYYLGDGQRWREIWALNAGRVHTDGTVMDTPRRLYAGWTILIPPTDPAYPSDRTASARHDVTVHPGDTLSGLAATDGISDWHQIWPANADRDEPDGQRLVDPNLIRPGWSITLPDPATARARPVTNGSSPSTNGAKHPPAQPGALANGAVPPHASESQPAVRPPSLTAPPSAASTPREAGPAGSAAPNPRGQQAQTAPAHDPLPVPLEVGLAAAAAVAVLDRARRIAQRRRRRGHRLLPPPPPLRDVEAQIRRDVRNTHPAVAAIQLATALVSESPPVVHAVITRDDSAVDLILDPSGGEAPAPFIDVPGGWRLPADATRFGYAVEDTDDPYPALAPIGRTGDGQVLIDLEASSPIAITGDPVSVTRYLAQVVLAVAGAPWSGRVQLSVPPPIADQLGSLDRLTVEDTTRPAPPVDLASRITPAVKEEPIGVTPDPEPVEPGWCTIPVYFYCGWSAEDDIDELVAAATDRTRHVVVLLNGTHPAAQMWTLDGDQLSSPNWPEPVTVTIPAADHPHAQDLIAYTCSAPDVPVGDPRLPELSADAPPLAPLVDPLADSEPGPRQLNLLGPVELTGIRWLRRGQILNLLTYLALHRRGVDRHQLVAALWPADDIPTGKTMRNRLTEARSLVGGAITGGPRWKLEDSVTTDWQQFTALAAGNPDEQRQALTLIRGRPFDGLDDADWIDLEGIRSEVEAAIVDLALTVGERHLADGDYIASLAATRAGLSASRYEERLHRLAVRAAEAAGLNGVVKTLKEEMRVALDLDIEPDDGIQPETLAMYEEMRNRPRVLNDRTR